MKNMKLEINGKEYSVDLLRVGEFDADVRINNRSYKVNIKDLGNIEKAPEPISTINATDNKTNATEASVNISTPIPQSNKSKAPGSSNQILAPLPGIILDIKVSVGDQIKAGDTVLIMEAMKMENEIAAETDGVVKDIKFRKEDAVLEGDVLIVLG